MRIIFIFFLLISMNVQATKYYVANAGSDASAGTSTGTAWQHVSKVNSTATSGDSVLFNMGDIWNEKLIPAANNIYYGYYGTGIKPTITGFQTVSGWVNVTGNIWRATTSGSVDSLKTVLLNGKMAIKGRYPNTGYLTFTSHVADSSITGSLSGTPNYTGKEIVVKITHWIIDVSNVKSQSGGTLNLTTKLTYPTTYDGNGYFFQNDSSFVDTLNEYSYNKSTHALIVYSVGSPSVQVSNIDTLAYLSSKNNITFDGISFTGANKSCIEIDTSRNCTIKNCSINYSGTIGVNGVKSAYATVTNDSIQNSLSGAIYLRRFDPYTPTQDTCIYGYIGNNYIKNTAIYAGMGLSNNERYVGIEVFGSHGTFVNNIIDSTGYVAIFWAGDTSLIYRNYITNFCLLKDDGGGIYAGIGAYLPIGFNSGSLIRSNIVLNGFGAPQGTAGAYPYPAPGIYLDGFSNQITVDSNTVDNCSYDSYQLSDGYNIKVTHNLFIDSIGIPAFTGGDITMTYNNNYFGNIYFSKNPSYQAFNLAASPKNNNIDSNYYIRPSAPTGLIKFAATSYSFPHVYQDSTGFDLHGGTTPTRIISNNYLLWINPTLSDSIFTVPATYVDAKGNYYYGYSTQNKVTLHPFQSLLLFKTIGEIYSGTVYGDQDKIR